MKRDGVRGRGGVEGVVYEEGGWGVVWSVVTKRKSRGWCMRREGGEWCEGCGNEDRGCGYKHGGCGVQERVVWRMCVRGKVGDDVEGVVYGEGR